MTAATVTTPTPASTTIGDIRFTRLARCCCRLARDGDRAVFDGAERPGGDVVAATSQVGGDIEPRGDESISACIIVQPPSGGNVCVVE
jgi:hypothetical protein